MHCTDVPLRNYYSLTAAEFAGQHNTRSNKSASSIKKIGATNNLKRHIFQLTITCIGFGMILPYICALSDQDLGHEAKDLVSRPIKVTKYGLN